MGHWNRYTGLANFVFVDSDESTEGAVITITESGAGRRLVAIEGLGEGETKISSHSGHAKIGPGWWAYANRIYHVSGKIQGDTESWTGSFEIRRHGKPFARGTFKVNRRATIIRR